MHAKQAVLVGVLAEDAGAGARGYFSAQLWLRQEVPRERFAFLARTVDCDFVGGKKFGEAGLCIGEEKAARCGTIEHALVSR